MTEIQVPWGSETIRTVVWSGVTEGLPVYFLEPNSKHKFFWRGRFYGEVGCRERWGGRRRFYREVVGEA